MVEEYSSSLEGVPNNEGDSRMIIQFDSDEILTGGESTKGVESSNITKFKEMRWTG